LKNLLPDLDANPAACLIGSFTKTLSPGTKCGFGIFPETLVDRLAPVIANTRLNPNYPTQAMIHHVIVSGGYDQYLRYLAGHYRPRMDALNKTLLKHLDNLQVPQVTGGFFTGIWLPEIGNEEEFVKAAKANGVNLATAKVFCPGWKTALQKAHRGPFFRLTFPSLQPREIEEGIERIGKTYKAMRSAVS